MMRMMLTMMLMVLMGPVADAWLQFEGGAWSASELKQPVSIWAAGCMHCAAQAGGELLLLLLLEYCQPMRPCLGLPIAPRLRRAVPTNTSAITSIGQASQPAAAKTAHPPLKKFHRNIAGRGAVDLNAQYVYLHPQSNGIAWRAKTGDTYNLVQRDIDGYGGLGLEEEEEECSSQEEEGGEGTGV
ncbi:hypothetical protein DFH27DRAFT_613678 [Peziza echinospora]|nr:hypothetical protein DFH27DRAFT_613678 [Peziza echinospora]